jgi:hypothetical protein
MIPSHGAPAESPTLPSPMRTSTGAAEAEPGQPLPGEGRQLRLPLDRQHRRPEQARIAAW